MSIRIALRHRMEQRFEHPVRLSTHWLRLRPAPVAQRRISAYSLHIDAAPHFINWVRDPFENHLARLDLPEPVARLGFDLELVAELEPVNPFDFLVEPQAANYPFEYSTQLRKELTPYLALPPSGPRFAAWVAALDMQPAYIVAFLTQFNHRLHAAISATQQVRPGPVDAEAVIVRKAGSPWELAWLATLALRTLGLAARFVSGYRVFLGERSSATLHAWTEVFLPGAGWIGLDPAGGLFADEGYVPLAAAPDPLRALPVVGYHEACNTRHVERVDVRLLTGEPAHWPMTPAQRCDLQAVGRRIDADLQHAGVGLTTQVGLAFVSAVEADLPEWNTAAPGPGKRRIAEDLLLRLRGRIGPGGLLQVGQGDRFAGESIPRWRLGCWVRADGVPVCKDPARIGWGRPAGVLAAADARRFGRHLALALGLSPEWLIPAHEDGLYRRWQQPAALDLVPHGADLRDPERRRALAAQLSRVDGDPCGFVLPLRWDAATGRWASGAWRMRRGAVFLLPGVSSMGYRLPLEGLPLAVQNQVEAERCQFDERPLLRQVHGEVSARMSHVGTGAEAVPDADADSPQGPRTAVCLEIREGRLHGFLPPLTHLEHYLELVAAIENCAESLGMSLVLEGYEPPEDHRLRRLVLEPDAGVLRVRLPAAADAGELESMIQAAFAAAAECGLRSERVRPDGSRFAPGAGTPLTLGGREPANSPFLRRPQVLRSLITYWHRHPSLSYLFGGRGIGAWGIAPRVDEGRDEALYELAIALERLPPGESAEPWLVDRVLRHLLTDPAGDMRHAEIRVDELYDPVRAGRRLGQVTLGCFEMAPAGELALLQVLLVRGLVARFLRFPETGPLRPWGAQLQDRFMLPRLLWADFGEVLEDLVEAGYPFQAEWFEPLVEQRLPILGQVQFGDIRLVLRQAHEPWPVLAEEVTSAGVGRFLDTALDRVQVCAHGLTPGRHALECNGESVPLQTAGVVGEYVAGVRYKACNPPATLHPTSAPIGALVFDLIDTWSGRVVGGFTYHPPEPGGWGTLGMPAATAGPPGGQEEDLMHPPVGMPVWRSGGRFEAGGSGRGTALPAQRRTDRCRPYLLDLSFSD